MNNLFTEVWTGLRESTKHDDTSKDEQYQKTLQPFGLNI